MEILPLFCEIDDFCEVFEKLFQVKALLGEKRTCRRATCLSQAEVMTIPMLYHASGYKNLKAFYLQKIMRHHRFDFPALCSYQRFVQLQLQSRCVMPLYFYL